MAPEVLWQRLVQRLHRVLSRRGTRKTNRGASQCMTQTPEDRVGCPAAKGPPEVIGDTLGSAWLPRSAKRLHSVRAAGARALDWAPGKPVEHGVVRGGKVNIGAKNEDV